jgi:hypothetical protein
MTGQVECEQVVKWSAISHRTISSIMHHDRYLKVIHVNKTDVAMGKDREFMLIGAAAEILPMLLERIEAGKT